MEGERRGDFKRWRGLRVASDNVQKISMDVLWAGLASKPGEFRRGRSVKNF